MLEGWLALTGQLMIGWSTGLFAYLITKYYEARRAPIGAPTVTPDRNPGGAEQRTHQPGATRLRISRPARRARPRGTVDGWAKPVASITSGSCGAELLGRARATEQLGQLADEDDQGNLIQIAGEDRLARLEWVTWFRGAYGRCALESRSLRDNSR